MLSAMEDRALEVFISMANKGGLHAMDWDIFFEFLINGHEADAAVDRALLANRLEEAKFPETEVTRLTDFYSRGRELLSFYFKWEQQGYRVVSY